MNQSTELSVNHKHNQTFSANPTFRWTLTLGLTPGYNPEVKERVDLDAIGATYREIAQRVYESTGVYVSATVVESRALYARDWGCPPGGEPTATFSGSCNPAFAEPKAYRVALDEIVRALKERYRQETVLLEITPCETVYYK